MKTRVIKGNDLYYAVDVLLSGGVIGLPLETAYGLAVNGLDGAAVSGVYKLKGQPEVKPVSLLVPNLNVAATVCAGIPKSARLLAEEFWPGPLTIVLPRRDTVPYIVTAGSYTVGISCPENPKTLALLCLVGIPIFALPASLTDTHLPKSAGEVLTNFEWRINCIIDGGRCTSDAEPTVVSLTTEPYKILHQGTISEDRIRQVLTSTP